MSTSDVVRGVAVNRSMLFRCCKKELVVAASIIIALPARADTDPTNVGQLKGLSFEQLMSVEVTSVARHPETLLRSASAIQVITQEDIRRSGATSLAEVLRLADNLEVAQKNSHDWAISARGFNTALANKLLVMIDGRTVYTPLFSGVFWDIHDYPLEDIDRIEVISGPGGALWGENAVSGVINIITKSAKDTQGAYVEGGGSQFDGLADGRYGGTISSDTSFRVYGKYSDRGEEVVTDGAPGSDAGIRSAAASAWTQTPQPATGSRCRAISTMGTRMSRAAVQPRRAVAICWADGVAASRMTRI
jgi:iron complex outermembrane receptor protein